MKQHLTTTLYTVTLIDSSCYGEDDVNVVHFSGVTSMADRRELTLRFEPKGVHPTWIGTFTAGYAGKVAITDVLPFEDGAPECLVVSAGQGFVVSTVEPRSWLALHRPFPITFAQTVKEHGFVVLADMTSVTALAASRVLWAALDIADGELHIEDVGTAGVRGRGWSAPRHEFRPFLLDLETGEHIS